jgi:hypothetical protein
MHGERPGPDGSVAPADGPLPRREEALMRFIRDAVTYPGRSSDGPDTDPLAAGR